MWTNFSTSCWICLLTLAVVMLFPASEVDSQTIHTNCGKGNRSREIKQIKNCYEQKPRHGCKYHAYLIKTTSDTMIWVQPTPPWLKKLLDTGDVKCLPIFSKKRRLEVLDDDDVE